MTEESRPYYHVRIHSVAGVVTMKYNTCMHTGTVYYANYRLKIEQILYKVYDICIEFEFNYWKKGKHVHIIMFVIMNILLHIT